MLGEEEEEAILGEEPIQEEEEEGKQAKVQGNLKVTPSKVKVAVKCQRYRSDERMTIRPKSAIIIERIGQQRKPLLECNDVWYVVAESIL